MITLNLLPPTQKEKIKKMAICSICENVIAGIFIFLSLITIALLIANNTLQSTFARFTIAISSPDKEEQQLNRKIKNLNSNLKIISDAQAGFTKWSKFLIDLNPLVPKDIQITNLEINTAEENILKIIGKAKKRTDLLAFHENLENHPSFTKIESPLSNILQKENIDFNFNIQFDK